MEITLKGEKFFLLFHKAIFRPSSRQLILADIHLGKTSHFRKHGLPLPPQSHLKDLDKLRFLIAEWQPSTVLILGDLFHSQYNREWLWFKALLMEHPNITFILVEGNHDILPPAEYQLPNLLNADLLEEENFIFSHAPLEDIKNKLNFCGHLHPGIRLTGIARQSITLPCFYNTHRHFVIPAFGDLTGIIALEKEGGADIYPVTHETVVKI
jgi:DNA ligase-associated metallophosphoesterase